LAAWWTVLNDPELNSLIERALVANPDLDIALTRLQQARTYESVVLGHALPAIDASAAAGRGTGSDLTRGRANQALVSADNGAGLQHINLIAGFDAVWELDLFGKFRREFGRSLDTQAAMAARNGVSPRWSRTWRAPMWTCAACRFGPESSTRRTVRCANRCAS
jgi:outer membrane protein TolC